MVSKNPYKLLRGTHSHDVDGELVISEAGTPDDVVYLSDDAAKRMGERVRKLSQEEVETDKVDDDEENEDASSMAEAESDTATSDWSTLPSLPASEVIGVVKVQNDVAELEAIKLVDERPGVVRAVNAQIERLRRGE